MLGAKQRPLLGGQALGWDRKAPGSTALIAGSLALWELTQRSRSVPAAGHPARVAGSSASVDGVVWCHRGCRCSRGRTIGLLTPTANP